MEENKTGIPIIEIPKIKVYTKLDSNKVIKEVNSSIFIQNLKDWIEVDEGIGDKFAHAQSQYLEKGLVDENGRYNYKFDTTLVELTEEEKNILFPPVEPQPTEIELLKEKVESQDKVIEELMFNVIPEIAGGGI